MRLGLGLLTFVWLAVLPSVVSAQGGEAPPPPPDDPYAPTQDERLESARRAFVARDWLSAARGYEAIVEADASEVRAWAGLGAARLAAGDARGAVLAYRRATLTDAGGRRYRYALAAALRSAGMRSDAQREIEVIRQRDPADPRPRIALELLGHDDADVRSASALTDAQAAELDDIERLSAGAAALYAIGAIGVPGLVGLGVWLLWLDGFVRAFCWDPCRDPPSGYTAGAAVSFVGAALMLSLFVVGIWADVRSGARRRAWRDAVRGAGEPWLSVSGIPVEGGAAAALTLRL